jgi:hypothetical protein
MRKLTFTLLLTCVTFLLQAQFPIFTENFDIVPPGCVVSSGTPGWDINSRLQVSAPNSDTTFIDVNSDTYLTSNSAVCPMATTGFAFVLLSFDHICKVEFFDSGTIEVSTDGGVTWVKLQDNNQPTDNCIYMGSSAFETQNSKFQEASYAAWDPGQANVPDNTWWQHEVFDISQIAGNQADLRIRFRLFDENGTGNATGRTGWAVDNIDVTIATCELNPPVVVELPPIYPPQVYNIGPFDVNIDATDQSGILSAVISYSINSVSQGTINMTNTVGPNYTGQLPAVSVGDTVCYSIQVTDNSGCFNVTTLPSDTSTICFVAENGITFPFCDFFDIPNSLWTTAVDGNAGSIWEKGDPFFGATTGAHTQPNAWDINLTTAYTNSADASLISPVFTFSTGAGATLEFWQNRNAEQGWDGVVLQYTFDDVATNPTPTWNVLGSQGCVNCVNWYNDNQLNSSQLPGWTGNSGGWVSSSIELDTTFNNRPIVYFRFRFTSDGSVTSDGFSIDDFCISLPQPDDVGVNAILSPGANAPAGSVSDVTVELKNFGINTQTTFDVSYDDGVNPPVTETWTGNLAAGLTTNFTFAVQDSIPVGQFTICAYTSLPGDGNTFNDTSCIQSLGIPVNTITFCDDFESGNLGWQDSTSNANNQWQLGSPAFGVTTGANSGTIAWDINLATNYLTNARSFLKSPFFDLSSAVNPILSFWRNQNSASNFGSDGLRVEYALNGSSTFQTLGTMNDPDGFNWYNNANIVGNTPGFAGNSNGWVECRYFLTNVIGAATLIQFRLVFSTAFNGQPNDGVSIDDFCVIQPGPDDVGVVFINQPIDAIAAGTNSPVDVVIRNFGSQPQTSIDVEYTIDGTITGSGTFTGTLAPGATAAVALTNLTVPSGAYDFCAYTQLPGDSDNNNDTLCGTKIGIPVILVDYLNPYDDNFDNTNVGWYQQLNAGAGTGSVWEWGTPAWGATNFPFSPPNAWDINLTTAYGPNSDAFLVSPIFDIQGVDPEMGFKLNYNTEMNWDGTRLEYSVNAGPWTMLGGFGPTFGLPCWQNWYTIASIISSTQPAWAGNSAGYKESKANCLAAFDPLFDNNQIQFRYVFTSDASVNIDGVSLDDFYLSVPVPLSAAPTSLNTNTINNTFVFPGQVIDFNSDITNRGTTALDTLIVTLTVDGPAVEIDTLFFSPALARDDFINHVWQYNWTASPGVHDICVITSEPNFSPDLNPSDDTLCIQISVFDSVTIASGNPYCTDYESGPTWVSVNALTYIDGPANSFELGTPAQTIINGALSGSNAWMTNLTTNYNDRDSAGLFTPVFSIEDTKCYRLSFSHIFDTEKHFDGGTIEYSIDNANTWQQLGWSSASPDWFNTPFITGLGGIPGTGGWSGLQPTWENVFQDVNFLNSGATTVIFRFRFQSDPSGSNFEGWAIDDFCFEEVTQPCLVSVEEPNTSALVLGQNIPNPFESITNIKFTIPENGTVRLFITDMLGREIAVPVEEYRAAGSHNVDFDSGSIAPGMYYYTLDFNGERVTRKMMVNR